MPGSTRLADGEELDDPGPLMEGTSGRRSLVAAAGWTLRRVPPGLRWRLLKVLRRCGNLSRWVEGPFVVRTVRGSRMLCSLTDFVQNEIFWLGWWEEHVARVIEVAMRKGGLFVDVGANVGYCSLLASRIVGDRGRVIALEPSPETARRLNENIALNGCDNVDVHCLCASDRSTTVTLHLGPPGNLGGHSMRPLAGCLGTLRVPADRLDHILEARMHHQIVLVKIDVEGAEQLVLRGMGRILEGDRAPPIICEVDDESIRQLGGSLSELLQTMSNHGYTPWLISSRGRLQPLEEVVGQVDLLFLKDPAPFAELLRGVGP